MILKLIRFIVLRGKQILTASSYYITTLAQADVGIAVVRSCDIAVQTAGIVLVDRNPKDIVNLILFGKATHLNMMQNLIWATGYNVVALPLAASVLYHWGILLSSAIGGALKAVSTIVVAINASMLKEK